MRYIRLIGGEEVNIIKFDAIYSNNWRRRGKYYSMSISNWWKWIILRK